eukprot:CAMPEP_0185783806 /NCGR_PEP_ID=MMETSP1174-20130828/119131_1 /TAXON_ID=35687 /ORGANISM="Dictyocha speculum, Strain CCMP1381" /LENGTH=148 /DNA_ID=CAMNT_0028475027 /DNA_START=12 /DNA_END=455 /DNA_ORIENTATION=+
MDVNADLFEGQSLEPKRGKQQIRRYNTYGGSSTSSYAKVNSKNRAHSARPRVMQGRLFLDDKENPLRSLTAEFTDTDILDLNLPCGPLSETNEHSDRRSARNRGNQQNSDDPISLPLKRGICASPAAGLPGARIRQRSRFLSPTNETL